MHTKALVVLSGGQDSTTCLYWAKFMFDEVHAITFDYGQTHMLEIRAAEEVAAMAKVKTWELICIPDVLISKSPLTDGTQPLERYESFEQMEETIGDRRELTFVPMRNALFLTLAANRAEALGIHNIVIGVCEQDNANYDDCRAIFIKKTQDYINAALGHDHRDSHPIHIHTPLIEMSKADIVKFAKGLGGCWEALAHTHTSYDGKFPPTDMNHANVLRAQGFQAAGLPDPLVVRAWKMGVMDLPLTPNYDATRGEK